MQKSDRWEKVYKMSVASVYPFYLAKAKKKGRSCDEVDEVICWLTRHTKKSLQKELDNKTDFKTFFKTAPKLNPKRKLITGMICGMKIEEIEEKLIREIRYMDKLVDELAKGKTLDKILRK